MLTARPFVLCPPCRAACALLPSLVLFCYSAHGLAGHAAGFPCPHPVAVSVSRPLLLCSIVDFPRWFKTNDSYSIPYQEGFEPYVLVRKLSLLSIQQAGRKGSV